MKKERCDAQVKNAKMWYTSSILANVLLTLSRTVVYVWLIYKTVQGEMTIGNFSLYLASATTFYDYISKLLNSVSRICRGYHQGIRHP